MLALLNVGIEGILTSKPFRCLLSNINTIVPTMLENGRGGGGIGC